MIPNVKKKNNRKVSKYLIVIFISIIVLLVAIAYIVINSKTNENSLTITSKNKTAMLLNDYKSSDISFVEINPTNHNSFKLSFDDVAEEVYIVGDKSFPLDQGMASEVFATSLYIEASEFLAESDDMLALKSFGISEDSFNFSIYLKNGSSDTWYIGSEINTEIPQRYMWNKNTKSLYVTKHDYTGICNISKEQLHPVPEVNFTPDIIDGITVGNLSLINKDGLWEMKSPFVYPLNNQKLDTILNRIGKLYLGTYVGEASDENILKYGLGEGSKTIKFDIARTQITVSDLSNAETIIKKIVEAHSEIFIFGNEYLDIGWYCLYQNKIYFASKFTFGFLYNLSSDNIISRNLINVPAFKLKSLSVKAYGKEANYSFDLVEKIAENNDLIADSYGQILYDFWVHKDGLKIESESFLELYQSLLHLEAFSMVDLETDSKIIYKMDVSYADIQRKIAIHEYNSVCYLVKVNDIGILIFEKQSIDKLLGKLISL